MLEATRPHIEMYRATMEERGLAASTIDRRLEPAAAQAHTSGGATGVQYKQPTICWRVGGELQTGQAWIMTPEEAADRIALRALVEEYAWMADTFDYQGYAALFTPDATFTGRAPGADEPFVRIAGHEALTQALHANDRFAQTFHAVHNHRCEVDADRASGVTYCIARHYLEADSKVIITPLRYHDTYLRTPNDGWRFSSRDLRFTWVEKVAADPEEFKMWAGQSDRRVR